MSDYPFVGFETTARAEDVILYQPAISEPVRLSADRPELGINRGSAASELGEKGPL